MMSHNVAGHGHLSLVSKRFHIQHDGRRDRKRIRHSNVITSQEKGADRNLRRKY